MELVSSPIRSANHLEQTPERVLAQLRNAHSNGRETQVLGQWDVVESRDRNVLRN